MEDQYVYSGAIILVVILALLALGKLSRGTKQKSADDTTNEVDVYLAYGLEENAFNYLRKAETIILATRKYG